MDNAPIFRPATIARALAAAALAASLSGCVVAPAAYGPDVFYAPVAPPPARVEYYGPSPYPGAVWIGGYWGWSNGRHHWRDGHWDRGRDGYRWRDHSWENDHGRWRQRPGEWERRR